MLTILICTFSFLMKHVRKVCCCFNRNKNLISSVELQEKDTTDDVDYEGYLLHEYKKPALNDFTLSEYTEKGLWSRIQSLIFFSLINIIVQHSQKYVYKINLLSKVRLTDIYDILFFFYSVAIWLSNGKLISFIYSTNHNF